jgi:PKD repeat protein
MKFTGKEGDMPRLSWMAHVLLILIVFLLAGATMARAEGEYVDNQDGTITDTKHAIMWQKADDGVERSWQEADDYCKSLALAGHSDWTLPKAYQLEGLINTAYSPTIDPLFSVKGSYYWSATESTSSEDSAKYVNFFYGNSYTYSKNHPYYALCVREAKSIPGRELAAVFTGAPESGKPLVIRFTATVTGGTEPYFYEWEFGDGSTSSASAPTHDFSQVGHYTVLLTVSDNNGAVAAANQDIALPLAEVPAAGMEQPAKPSGPPAKEVPALSEPVPQQAELPSPPTGHEGETRTHVTSIPEETPPPVANKVVDTPGNITAAPTGELPPKTSKAPPSGILEVAASGKGAPYKDGALGHGLLAYTFANAMAGDGDWNKDGSIAASELQAYLGQAIKSLSKGQQSPEISLNGDDFPVCSSSGSTFVFAIGVGHDLAGSTLAAGQDAELVRKALEDKCKNTKTMMLTGNHANRPDILEALLRIQSMVTTNDTLVVYVGAASGQDNGRLNWYVNDTRKELPWFTGIYQDDLVNSLKTMSVGHLVVLSEKN